MPWGSHPQPKTAATDAACWGTQHHRVFVSHWRITAKKFAIVHGARLVRKDAEFCRQPRKESKSALCRLSQCSLRCQIPPAGVSPGVRQEAQAQPSRGRVLSTAGGRGSHYTALPQACPPQSVSSPFFSFSRLFSAGRHPPPTSSLSLH